MQLGEFKQEIIKLNNKINMEIFGTGYIWQKIDVIDNKVCILAKCKSILSLSAIEESNGITARLTSLTLMEEYKRRFIEALKDEMNITALSHLEDYDSKSQVSFSITILEKNVEELIVEIYKNT